MKNILKSPVSIELEELRSVCDYNNTMISFFLKESAVHAKLMLKTLTLVDGLKEIANNLNENGILVQLEEFDLSIYRNLELSLPIADDATELESVLSIVNKISKFMMRASFFGTVSVLIGMLAYYSDFISDYIFSSITLVSMLSLIISRLSVMRKEKEFIKRSLNHRVKIAKENATIKAITLEMNKDNTFIKERINDIKSSISALKTMGKNRRNTTAIQEEFIVINAVIKQILHHLEKGLVGKR